MTAPRVRDSPSPNTYWSVLSEMVFPLFSNGFEQRHLCLRGKGNVARKHWKALLWQSGMALKLVFNSQHPSDSGTLRPIINSMSHTLGLSLSIIIIIPRSVMFNQHPVAWLLMVHESTTPLQCKRLLTYPGWLIRKRRIDCDRFPSRVEED